MKDQRGELEQQHDEPDGQHHAEQLPDKHQPDEQHMEQGQSLHLYPEWKEDFRRNFSKIVVEKCSQSTKEAFANNEDIKVLEISNQL